MKVSKKRIVGISRRTSFIRAQSEIGSLWQKFYSEDIGKKVLKKKSSKIYAVYYDFESDYKGEYKILIGYETDEETGLDSVVIGEGASGGALGIGLCDKMIMLENTWFSVISPEGCASILWKDSSKAPEAAKSLKLTPKDLMEHNICNMIVYEPSGGAHRHFDATADILKETILSEIKELQENLSNDFLESRVSRYDKLGVFREN